MQNTHEHLVDTLGYLMNALDVHDYDTADKKVHMLCSSYCGLKHNPKKLQQARNLVKKVKNLDNIGQRIALNEQNTKLIREIKRNIIQLE